MEYLRLFEQHSQYTAYTASTEIETPHVSYCRTQDEVHYDPKPPIVVVAKFNVTDTSNPTPIGYNKYTSGFSAIEIDGVVQPNVVSAYTFDTTGEHTVKYTLKDPTTIGFRAFQNCNSLTSIDIPNSVTSIDRYALSHCTSLTSIDIPSGVTSIGDRAFEDCSGLTSIDIPNSVTTISDYVFEDCSGLTSCTIGSGVTYVGPFAFNGTPWIVTYSADVNNQYGNIVYINDIAYKKVSDSITYVQFKETTKRITEYAFAGCKNITSVTIPDSVTSIGENAFDECSSLTSCTIGNGVTSIGSSTFAYCSGLISCTIGSSVTRIGVDGFLHCRNLTSIVCNATTAPTIQSTTFLSVKTGGTLTVPSGSSGYDVWMGTGDCYLGKYNWTKVEQ